jgi:glycine cleavage system H protein
MADLYYTEEHEWVRVEGDIAECGISNFAQEQLGDVVFVELPEAGREVAQNDECAVVESVKAASDIYAPVSGEIIAANDTLEGDPGLVNSNAMDDGWFFKIKLSDPSELENLMDADEYTVFCKG